MEARRRLRPPRELGRVAFSQDQSGNGHPVMSEREAHIAESKALEALAIYSGGQVRRAKATLGSERQDLSRVSPSVNQAGQVSGKEQFPLSSPS